MVTDIDMIDILEGYLNMINPYYAYDIYVMSNTNCILSRLSSFWCLLWENWREGNGNSCIQQFII